MLGLQITCSDVNMNGLPSMATTISLPQPTFTGTTTPTFIYMSPNGASIPNPAMFDITALSTGSLTVDITVLGIVGLQQDTCVIRATITGRFP